MTGGHRVRVTARRCKGFTCGPATPTYSEEAYIKALNSRWTWGGNQRALQKLKGPGPTLSQQHYRCLRNRHPSEPYEFTGFGAMDATKPHKFIWFGEIHGPKHYKLIGFRCAFISRAPVAHPPNPPLRDPRTRSQLSRRRRHHDMGLP